MRADSIYIGNIIRCTNYEDQLETLSNSCKAGKIDFTYETYKSKAILIKLKDRRYVDLDTLNSLLDIIKIETYKNISRNFRSDLIIRTRPSGTNKIFVDEKSLIPFKEVQSRINISMKELKSLRK